MSECFAGPCRCCECRGIHCLVWHPGHSHRFDRMTQSPEMDALIVAIKQRQEDIMQERLREACDL